MGEDEEPFDWDWNSRQEPLRDGLSRGDEHFGVTATLYEGEEATVVLAGVAPEAGNRWVHMDVEYTRSLIQRLMSAYHLACMHNERLDTLNKKV